MDKGKRTLVLGSEVAIDKKRREVAIDKKKGRRVKIEAKKK